VDPLLINSSRFNIFSKIIKTKTSKLPGKVLLQIFGGLGKKPELKKN